MNKLKQRLCALLCTTILIGTTGAAYAASDFTNDMKLAVSARLMKELPPLNGSTTIPIPRITLIPISTT